VSKKTKVYKIELFIVDGDNIGEDEVRLTIEHTHYPNHSIDPTVVSIVSREVEWGDDHPLNKESTFLQAYKELFNERD
jgi:hypothetical protein